MSKPKRSRDMQRFIAAFDDDLKQREVELYKFKSDMRAKRAYLIGLKRAAFILVKP